MTPDEWTALAVRCEAADGPDREIDHAIFQSAFPGIGEPSTYCSDDSEPIYFHAPGAYRKQPGPLLTSSLDAIVALIGEKLPGLSFELFSSGFSGAWARLSDPMRQPGFGSTFPRGDGQTPALALCAAFCRAMAARALADEEGAR